MCWESSVSQLYEQRVRLYLPVVWCGLLIISTEGFWMDSDRIKQILIVIGAALWLVVAIWGLAIWGLIRS